MNAILVEDGVDAGLVWHHGNPVAEARAIEAGEAVVDLSNRDVLEITGADRLGWLHSLTSQHLESLGAGESFEALVLSPNGHVEHVLAGVDDGTRMLAWTEPGRAAALVAFLTSMRFMTRVEVRPRAALPLMQGRNGALVTLSYLGAVRAVPNYNTMGVAKASLEASVRYLARSLGPKGIRANGISAGPIKTLAAAGIKGLSSILAAVEAAAPLHRNVTIEEVGNAAAFLLSDLASGITGEITYVDAGYSNALGGVEG